jgi:hypothetical protein
MFGLESECKEQCGMQQLNSCVDYLVAMARAGNCRETTRIYYYNKPDSIWHHRRHVTTRISLHFHSSTIGLSPSPSPSRHYTSIIIDGAAAFTKTNKKKWQQTVTWNETYNAPTMHTLGT